jgi:hypothetical protein
MEYLSSDLGMAITAKEPAPAFSDTDEPFVVSLYRAGIIRGRSETVFAPDDLLTREETAAVLFRIANYFDLQKFPWEGAFTDAQEISPWPGTRCLASAAWGS